MSKLTPKEVFLTVSADFKIKGITRAEAASRLGIKSKQTLTNILCSDKYLSEMQAMRFNKAFGYSKAFLMTGVGQLDEELPPEKDRWAFNSETNEITQIDETQSGDIELMLHWFRELLSRQGNGVGLAIWAEISRFSEARRIVKNNMVNYKGDNFSYQAEFDRQLWNLHSECVENIQRMLNGIGKDPE